jgi:hypothetical protein
MEESLSQLVISPSHTQRSIGREKKGKCRSESRKRNVAEVTLLATLQCICTSPLGWNTCVKKIPLGLRKCGIDTQWNFMQPWRRMKFYHSLVNEWNWRISFWVRLAWPKRPKIVCSPSYADIRSRANTTRGLDFEHDKSESTQGRGENR